jgi:serine phosphatase RsbU (regulator of sigma subunit)
MHGSRPAKFFLIAWSMFLVLAIIRTSVGYNLIPANFMTLYADHFGYMAMLTLLSIGLADRINSMKNDLAELNINLEKKVVERTLELQTAMEELEAMNDSLSQRTNELQAAMEELEAINEELTRTRDALWGEMQLAKKIQTVLLPKDISIPGYEITAFMEPADEVGGDYYDVITLNGRSWVLIGDVSGHGVPAGLIMMMAQTAIRNSLRQNGDLKPSQLLTIVNQTISENIKKLGEDKYMTITAMASLDDGAFSYSGLHQDIIVYRADTQTVEMLETTGMWFGIIDDLRPMIRDDQLKLDSGDTMLLYSDGVTEAFDANGQVYSEEALIALMKRHGQKKPHEIKDAILDSLKRYRTDDDITILVIRRQ